MSAFLTLQGEQQTNDVSTITDGIWYLVYEK